ncbi:MAG: hypothetical protein Kow0068_03080 [Marinilabiliales bacterium]
MKTKLLTTIVVSIAVITLIAFLNFQTEKRQYFPRNHEKNMYEAEGASKWYMERHVNINTGKIETSDIIAAREAVAKKINENKTKSLNLDWVSLGPDNQGGRARCLLIDKNNPNVMYIGAASGGLWKTTTGGLSWFLVSDDFDNIAISCITQAANGDIYFGTGEYFAPGSGTNYNTGMEGQGIWKSTDGSTFTRLSSTWSTTDNTIQSTFNYINELAADPNDANKIYAATNRGLLVTTDGGTTWTNTTSSNSPCKDVKISGDGSLIIAQIGTSVQVSHNSGSSFTVVSGTGSNQIPLNNGRIEFAIAPSDYNYVYASAVKNDTLLGIYQSKDKGLTWTKISPVGEGFRPFRNGDYAQGNYDNTIAVYPNDPEKILVGGINLWKWQQGYSWSQISYWIEYDYIYVHADQHGIYFHPNYDGVNNKVIYFVNDGGIFRSLDGGNTFAAINKNLITTQFYTVAYSSHGEVVGGTQDNGTQYIDYKGNTLQTSVEIKGGDGSGCALSALDTRVAFASSQYGSVSRSDNPKEYMGSYLELFDSYLLSYHNIGSSSEPFVTQIALYENFNDPLSVDTVTYILPVDFTAGNTYNIPSGVHGRDIPFLADKDYSEGDTIKLVNPYQAVLAVGLNGQTWITRKPLDFSNNATKWYPIMDSTYTYSTITSLAWSKDGDILYISDYNNVYRCSNINNARTSFEMNAFIDSTCVIETHKLGSFNAVITDVAVDPSNPNNLVVTLGNYGTSSHIYYSVNAATTTSESTNDNFFSIQGDLPSMPVFTAVIQWNDSRKVIVGTEYGVWTCSDITASTPTWAYESDDIGMAPVYMMRQQPQENFWLEGNSGITNHGVIYAGTHGRGLFKCETLRGPLAVEEPADNTKTVNMLKIYPNPVIDKANIDYTLKKSSKVDIYIYSLNGKLIKHDSFIKNIGKHTYTFNTDNLESGTYIVKLYNGESTSVNKFVVY